MMWAPEPKIQSFPFGARSIVLAEGFYAPYYRMITTDWDNGDLSKAFQTQEFVEEVHGIVGIGGAKNVLRGWGINLGPNRLPSGDKSEAQIQEMLKKLQDIACNIPTHTIPNIWEGQLEVQTLVGDFEEEGFSKLHHEVDFVISHPHPWYWSADSSAANDRSDQLMTLIDDYLDSPITWSESLRFVAQLHCDDLEFRWHSYDWKCDSFYSWSYDGGPWERICINDYYDGLPLSSTYMSQQANQVRRLTGGDGDGYPSDAYIVELAREEDNATPGSCYQAIIDKSSYRDVLKADGQFNNIVWKAYGCAVSGRFCSCWFGDAVDSSKRNFQCQGTYATDPEVCGGGAGVEICTEPGTCKGGFYNCDAECRGDDD